MKKLITNYTFNKTSKTITLTDYATVLLEQWLVVTNVTDNVMIYNFVDPALGGSAVDNVLTLDYDTSSMDNGDDLQIFIDDTTATQPVSATDLDIRNLVNTDVVTAELSAVDNAVLDTIAAKDFATQTTLSAVDTKIAALTRVEDTAAAGGESGMPMLGVRRDADTSPVSADGDWQTPLFDEDGRMKTSTRQSTFPICSGVLTTTAASASSTVGDVATAAGYLSVNVIRASNVVLHVKNTGGTNQTAGNFTFEASIDSTTGTDGTWFGIQVVRSNANTIELTTGTLTLNAGIGLGYSYESSVNAYTWFRVRVGTNITTGAADTWTIIRGSYATEPIPAIQTHAVTGTLATTMAAHATNSPAKARDVASGANDTGIPAWYIRRDTPTNVTPVAGDWEPAQIDAQGSQWVREKYAATSALTNVAASASSVTVLALNTARRSASFYNDSTAICYLKLGATASSTSFTVKMKPDAFYEIPGPGLYSGVIDCIWASATGSMRVTEIS